MANNSTYGGFIRWDTDRLFYSGALDTARVQEAIVDNQEHLYTTHGQIRMNYFAMQTGNTVAAIVQKTATGGDELDFIHSFGPFTLTQTSDGRTCPLYLEFNGGIAGTGDPIGTFIFNLRSKNQRKATSFADTGSADWNEVNAPDSTQTWRVLNLSSSMIYVPATKENTRLGNMNSRVSASVSVSRTVDQREYYLDVFGREEKETVSTYYIYGMYAREVPSFTRGE